MQPSKTGVETNVNDDERFWEDDPRKKLLKQIKKIKAAIAVWYGQPMSSNNRLDYVQFKLFNLVIKKGIFNEHKLIF